MSPDRASRLLLPRPRQLRLLGGLWDVPSELNVTVEGPERGATAWTSLVRHTERLGLRIRQTARSDRADVQLRVASEETAPPQGYRLRIDSSGVDILAADPAGLFYGVATLVQWLGLHAGPPFRVPNIEIEDHPDFLHRGVLLDISRNRVPTVETVEGLVDQLAGFKINQLQLYTEHTFAYAGHEAVWQGASPWTAEEVRRLDAFCQARHVELVPNQNSFGHLHRWLIHEPYRQLAECPEGIEHPFSLVPEPFSVCPTDPRTLDWLRDLYTQLLPNFTSGLFNVGLDETLDLGKGRSAALCTEHGTERVYLEFLRQVAELVRTHGRRMMFWGDVILQRPELIPDLPRDAIALEWGYEADHPFADDVAHFARSGLEFYVCPGTSSWNSLAGRYHNAVANLASAARHGRDHGALGYLITDWGDHGHLQPWPVSLPGFVAGAAMAWNAEDAERPGDLPVPEWLNHHTFRDRAGVLGGLIRDLGNIYRLAGGEPKNGSILFFLPFFGLDALRKRGIEQVTVDDLDAVLRRLDELVDALPRVRSEAADAGLLGAEIAWLFKMLRFACRCSYRRLGRVPPERIGGETGGLDALIDDLRPIWLARHRPGGLAESVARLERLRTLV